jgi:hypothetical protein
MKGVQYIVERGYVNARGVVVPKEKQSFRKRRDAFRVYREINLDGNDFISLSKIRLLKIKLKKKRGA